MRELRSQEGDINYLYRQLQQLSRVLKEGSTLLAQKDTVTNVDDYLTSCKVSEWVAFETTENFGERE